MHQNRKLTDESVIETSSNLGALPPVYITKWHYVCLICFTLSCYVGSMTTYQILDQYVFHRYAIEVGLPGEGLNRNSSSCHLNRSDPDYQLQTEAHERSAKLNLYSSLMSGIPGPVAVLIMGAYSDRMGRKWSIFVPWMGMCVSAVIQIVWMQWELDMTLYVIAQLPIGLTGGYATLIAAMFAILCDTTNRSQRSLGLAVGEAGLGLSILISSIFCGWFIRISGFYLPFNITCGLLFISGVFLYFLPETSSVALLRRHASSWNLDESLPPQESLTPWKMLKQAFQIYTAERQRGILLLLLSAVYFVELFASIGSSSLLTLYLLNQPFCWDSVYLGYYRGANKVLLNVMCIALVALCKRRLGDLLLILIGVISFCLANVNMGLAGLWPYPLYHYAASASVVIGMCGGLIVPLVRSMLSQTVKESETGTLFGSLGALESLAFTCGSLAGNAIYSATVSTFPGTLFISQGVLIATGIIFIIFFHNVQRQRKDLDRIHLINAAD